MTFKALLWLLTAVWIAALAVATYVILRKLRRLRRILRHQERFIWQSQSLHQLLAFTAPVPFPGGWAASSDLLLELVSQILRLRPQRVVELGSGLSTLVIASALRRIGHGRVVSIDADATYAEQTRAQLALHGLSDYAEVRIAPLKEFEFEGERRPWFDTDALQDLQQVELLFVDGPPTARKADIRYPSLPFFWPRLQPGAVVLCDDAGRTAEAAMAARWQRAMPDADYEALPLDKGVLRITRR